MSPEALSIVVLFASFFGLLAYGLPVAYSIGVATTATLLLNIAPLPAVTTAARSTHCRGVHGAGAVGR